MYDAVEWIGSIKRNIKKKGKEKMVKIKWRFDERSVGFEFVLIGPSFVVVDQRNRNEESGGRCREPLRYYLGHS